MINLLPLIDKKTAARETIRRFTVFFGLCFAFLLLAELFFCLSYLILIGSVSEDIQGQLESLSGEAKTEDFEVLRGGKKCLSGQLASVIKSEEECWPVSLGILKFLDRQSSAVKLTSLIFERKQNENSVVDFSLGGSAATRADLLEFIDSLKKIDEVEEVQSPVSNLLSEKEVTFTLRIKMKKL